ncbi:hypothetical protein ACIPQ1_00780 [Pseudomonas sp. LARHCG127]
MRELFESKQWVGEFFTDNNFDNRFGGRVVYTPEDGVVLEYWVASKELPVDSKVVHGVLESGEKCSLIGDFSVTQSSISFKGGLTMRTGKVGFACMFVNDFISEDELFYDFDFSLTNLQEFFFPKGFKELVKFSDKPLKVIKTSFGEVKVTNNANFGSLHNDITKQIYSWDKDALQDLQNAFDKVKVENPTARFMLKKDIEYRLSIHVEGGADYNKVFEYITALADLFAILIYSPVHPESISVDKETPGDKGARSLAFFPSNTLSSKTLMLSSQQASHFHLPITDNKIDLELLIGKWLEYPDRFSTILSCIQTETGSRYLHSLHGELVLYATQLESISYDDKIKEKKYEYPLVEYGASVILMGVQKVFSKYGRSDIGGAISDLRNEIAHVGRPKDLMKRMVMEDLILLSQYMELTIIGFVLRKIGVDPALVQRYQKEFCPIL